MICLLQSRTQPIEKEAVWAAFKKVRSKGGSEGVDGVSIEDVTSRPGKYLHPVWSRLASGGYYPQAVKQVSIPKIDGSERLLGIPTVCDRVVQMTIREELEQIVEPKFHKNSFGYRPNRSAHQAVEQCKLNCMEYDWVIDLDIKGFFDNIDHELLMEAVRYHTGKKHLLLYTARFLKADVRLPDGSTRKNMTRGTPQGGAISPLLANIFLDIVFDKWMDRHYPDNPFERYADDVVILCRNFKEAMRLLKERLQECKLTAHRDKTKIVCCKSYQKYHPPFEVKYNSFDFLGFTFKTRRTRGKWRHMRLVFTPSMSIKANKRVAQKLCELKVHRWVQLNIRQVAERLAPQIRGWIRYFGKFNKTGHANPPSSAVKMGHQQISAVSAKATKICLELAT